MCKVLYKWITCHGPAQVRHVWITSLRDLFLFSCHGKSNFGIKSLVALEGKRHYARNPGGLRNHAFLWNMHGMAVWDRYYIPVRHDMMHQTNDRSPIRVMQHKVKGHPMHWHWVTSDALRPESTQPSRPCLVPKTMPKQKSKFWRVPTSINVYCCKGSLLSHRIQ